MIDNDSPKAIPFIVKNNNGSYQLTQQAENLINKINTPISIVTVAGLYRTGKSFLLNRVIINKSKGFNVGPTVNPCTKGLWIWNEPIYTADNISVLVVDTEGLGALDQQTNHDTKIFCLAVLLSTTFIYNSVGNIDQGALQNLSLVLNLVNSIDQDQQSNRPSFVWVVRDFSLQLVNQKGVTITPRQYLEMALNTQIVKESQKIAIRNTITKAFSQRDCFTLYKPLIDQTKLQNLDNVPLDDLRPQFVTQTMNLRKKIFSTLKQFKLNGCSNLKGPEYIMMTKKYITAINDGKVPNMTDTWTFIKQQKSRQVLQYLQEAFLEKVNTKLIPKLPIKEENMREIVHQLYSQLLNEFKNSTYHETSTQELEEFWQRIKKQILNANQQQRKQTLKNIFIKQFQGFSKKLNSHYYNELQQYVQDVKNNFKAHLLRIYGQKIDGFQQALQLFSQKKMTQGLKMFFNKQKLEIKKLMQIKNQIQITYQRQFKQMEENSCNQKRLLKNQLAQIQKVLLQKQGQKNVIENEQLTRKTQYQIQKHKLKAQKDEMKNIIECLKLQVSQYQSKNQDFEKNLLTLKKQFEKETALYVQKEQHLQNKLFQIESKYKHAKMEYEANGGKYQTQRKGIMANFEQKMKDLLRQNKKKSQKIFELQNFVEDLKQQNQKFKESIQQIQKNAQEQKKSLKQKLINDMSNKKQSFSFELQQSKKQINRIQQNYNRLIIETKQTQIKYKQLLDEIKQIKSNNQKQIAIHMQKIQFQQIQIQQLKITNEQLKKSYQKAMDAVQESSKNSQNKYQLRILQVSQQHQIQLKNLEKQFQCRYKEIKNQNYILSKQKQDLQIQISIQKNKYEAKQKQYKEYYQKMETNYQNLSMKYKTSEKDYSDISQEKETHFMMKIKQLQTELEDNKEKYYKELDQARRTSQQALSVLKNYSEMERQQSDKRLLDQRQKFQKKLKSQIEDMQKRMSEQKQSMEQEIAMLMQKLQSQQKYFNQKLQNLQYDYEIQMQKKINQFGEERVELNKRNALLNQQIQMTKKNLQNKLQQNARSYEQREITLRTQLQTQHEQALIKLKDDKLFVQQKLQALKKNNRQVQQANLMLKNDLDKQRALFKQKQHNLLKQINDLQSRLSNQIISHNKQMQEYTLNIQSERARLNSQITQLKMARSKLQQEKSKLRMQFQQEKQVYKAKNNYLQTKIKSKQEEFNDLLNKFQLTTTFLTKKNEELMNQLSNLKGKVHSDFQGKLKFKEDQFKKNMKELQDRILRFQTQNKSLRDKVILLEMKLNTNLKDQSNQYYESNQNIEQITENYQRKIEDMRVYIEKLKKEIKNLKNQKQILQLNQGLLNQSKITSKDQRFERSQRQSIINGLTHNNQFSKSRLEDDFSKSKIHYNQINRTPMSQVQGKRLSFLTQNKNIVNTRMQNQNQSQAPMVSANKYQRRTKNY